MKIGVIMGSDSDYEVVKKSLDVLKTFGVKAEVRVLSAHRTSDEAIDFAKTAHENGMDCLLAAAGKAAHLPGVLAAVTNLPVIGLPIKSSTMDGLDSLLSIVQMPKGIPVATVAINGAENAALLAVKILALKYPELDGKLSEYREEMRLGVLAKNQKVMEMTEDYR
jgi:5-(carboxyamino)imidazole ribonucleotide mutase